ncbi:MAG: hypothetical protein ACJZ5X_05295 [Opitutales bacterium]
MKKILLTILFICLLSASLGYMILFEGKFDNFEDWWDQQTRGSSSFPFSPYKKYRKEASLLYFDEANSIEFLDRHLFWKGSGAIAKPELSQDYGLVNIIVISGGYGYSDQVEAVVRGSGGQDFILGPVTVSNGRVSKVGVINSGTWTNEPLAFHGSDSHPFSGTAEIKFKSGQVIEEIPFLSGKKHGQHTRYNERGVPIFSKDYVHGKKSGTHIFWFSRPLDPDDYKTKSKEGYPSLWIEINEKAKEKFRKKYGTSESNEWVVSKYKLSGGAFGVKLLEHWLDNKKHGLFEGFDEYGNKTFKDEFKHGLRIKHRIFDKTK